MDFRMPDFPRHGNSITDNHTALLFAHELLSEDAPGVTLAAAEQELARLMPSFTFGSTKVEVGPNKYKTANLVFGLYKLHLQRDGQGNRFWIDVEDSWLILSFMSDAVIDDAKANPGKHPFVDYVLDRIEQKKPIELGVNLAVVA